MTRYYHIKKQRAENLKRMAMSFFTRYGYLKEDKTEQSGLHIWKLGGSIGFSIYTDNETRNGYIRIQASKADKQQGNSKEFDYYICLVATPCHFGGFRWWFIDPCDSLGRKCSVLYLQSNGYFASQKTLNLSYDTQNEGRGVIRAQMQSIRGIALYNKMKYQYRNGRPTRKLKRVLQYLGSGLSAKNYTANDIVNAYF